MKLPDFSRAWDYENDFYLACDPSRLSKFIVQYELFKQAIQLPGEIVECGVFKGTSLARLATFRSLFGLQETKTIYCFDVFGRFPETAFEEDKKHRELFVRGAGEEGLSVNDLRTMLEHKKCQTNIEFVAGNICETVPKFVADHPTMQIALLNLDTDVYEPAVTILEYLFPKLIPGGVLILDDYGVFPGETKAVDDFFRGRSESIQRFPFRKVPAFIIKESAS